ncbi:MAG: PAS domain S-box protein, partial [Chitinophagaceae bacterium]
MSQPLQKVVLYPIPLSPIPNEHFSASDEWLLLQDAVIQTDLQFNITGWNSTAELLYHFTDAFGKNLFEIIDLKFVKGSLEDLKLEMACSSCWKGEMIFTKSNGEKLYFLSIANYIVNERKRPVSIMIVSHNITDARKKEQQLAETENEYKTLVNTLFDGVLMIKRDGKISACNKRAAQIFGLKQDEMTGNVIFNSSWKAIHEDGSEFSLDEFPAMVTLQTGITKRDVIMGITKPDGQRVWVSINSKPINKGINEKPVAVVVTIKDITEERAKSEKLTKAQALFGSFIKNSQTAVWIYDTDGKILLANEVYDRITNSPGKAEGKYILEIFPNDFGKMLCRRNEELLRNEKPIVTSTELIQADGSIRNFLSYLFVINLPDGNRLIGGQALDVTEEKQATDKLKESESVFRMFMSSSPALGWIYDEYGNLLFGNPNFMKELGYTNDALGKNIDELAPNKHIHELITTRINNVLLNNLQTITEDVIIGNDGSRKIYTSIWFLMPLENGKRLIGGHAIDITEKKKNSKALKLATERFALALKVTADAIWDLDLKTNEIFRSDQFTNISGYKNEEIVSNLNWWFDRIHPEDKDRVKSKVQEYLDLRKETWEDE